MMKVMARTRYGSLARVFIAANRLFGAGALLVGVALSGDFAIALRRGVPLERSWWVGAFGLACIVGGLIYLRAPLTKD